MLWVAAHGKAPVRNEGLDMLTAILDPATVICAVIGALL